MFFCRLVGVVFIDLKKAFNAVNHLSFTLYISMNSLDFNCTSLAVNSSVGLTILILHLGIEKFGFRNDHYFVYFSLSSTSMIFYMLYKILSFYIYADVTNFVLQVM